MKMILSFNWNLRGIGFSKRLLLTLLLLCPLAAHSDDTYYVEILTGTGPNDGTDANFHIILEGDESPGGYINWEKRKIDNPGDDHQRGKWDYYKVTVPKKDFLGRLRKIRIRPDDESFTDGWGVEMVHIYGPSDPKWPHWSKGYSNHPDAKGQRLDLYRFPVRNFLHPTNGGVFGSNSSTGNRTVHGFPDTQGWADYQKGPSAVPFTYETAELVDNYLKQKVDPLKDKRKGPRWWYHVSVKTADRENAGTDDEVYITLYGTRGTMHEKLDLPDHDDHERGKTDIYRLGEPDYGVENWYPTTDIGRITHIQLSLKGDDGWLPAVVYVHGIADPEYPQWTKQRHNPYYPEADAYRFVPNKTWLDNSSSMVIGLDQNGRKDLAKVSSKPMNDWSASSQKWLYIHKIRCISPSEGIGDVARAMGKIGGYAVQVGLNSVEFGGFQIGEVSVILIEDVGGIDDWGDAGQGVVEKIDSFTAGADQFYYKINGKDIHTGKHGGLARDMNKKDVIAVNHRIHLNKVIGLELLDYDRIENDSMGGIHFNPNMSATTTLGGNHLIIASKDAKSIYEVNYYIVETPSQSPVFTVNNGKLVEDKTWQNMPSNGEAIVAGGGKVFLKKGAQLFQWDSSGNTWTWTGRDVKDMAITEKGEIWTIEKGNLIYRLKAGVGWQKMPSNGAAIVAGGGKILLVGTGGGLYGWDDSGNTWISTGRSVKDVAITEKGEIWTIEKGNLIYRLKAGVGWQKMPSNGAAIVAGGGRVFLKGHNGGALYSWNGRSNSWDFTARHVKDMAITEEGDIWTIEKGNLIYRHKSN